MDDAERDAWLREALRHAPDSGALPPTMISAAILAEARAAAARQAAGPAPRRASVAAANPLLALWSWLARPPVAAGFASVMAATLVGLMWWDRPMDETLARPPALERSEAKRDSASAPVDATITAAAPAAPTAPTPPTAAAPPAPAPMARAQSPARPARVAPAREAALGESANAERARAKDDAAAKERDARRKNDPPAAFPSTEVDRASRPAPQAIAQDAKKEADATPAPTTSPAPFASADRSASPPAAPVVASAATPLQSGKLASDEPRLAASNRADVGAAAGAMAKSAATSGSTTAPARDSAAPPAAAPLASLLGALSDNSTRWTRQTASGGSTAVETVWRDWLADLDAQARWRRVADSRQRSGADAEKQGTTTLRLDLDGRPGALIRLDGTTARVDILGADAAQWQATLAPAAAERLRAALARLPP